MLNQTYSSATPSQVWIFATCCSIFVNIVTTYDLLDDDRELNKPLPDFDPWDLPLQNVLDSYFQLDSLPNDTAYYTQPENLTNQSKNNGEWNNSIFNWDVPQRFPDESLTSERKPVIVPNKKRQLTIVERPFDIKPRTSKRARKEEPIFVPTPDKENKFAQIPTVSKPYVPAAYVKTPVQVYQQKGISAINLLINGESIECICGGPVSLPDFAQTVATNLHIANHFDALGCVKFNRKPTDSNIQNILKMVQARFQGAWPVIVDGGAEDDAVVFDRVKEVAEVLAGKKLDTFLDAVFFQESNEYFESTVEHRDYLENNHYRYFTHHMQFEVELLEVLRKYYPRNSPAYEYRDATPAAPPNANTPEAYNIRSEVDNAQSRSNFQATLLRKLREHLEKLPSPPRLKKKAPQQENTALRAAIARELYSHADRIDQQNIDNLVILARRSLGKGGNRLDALHIVQHLAFRYVFNARNLLFQEHSGTITMNSCERSTFASNINAIVSMLKAERQFTRTVPNMFGEMIHFITGKAVHEHKIAQSMKPNEHFF